MKEKTKNIVVVIGFVAIIFILLIANIVKKDEEISLDERRKLSQFPTITFESVIKGEVSEKFEEYAVDQFISRSDLRSIKSFWSKYIFGQKDNNGLFLKDNSIYKIEYPLNVSNVQKSADKIYSVYEKYLQGMNVYYAIIPDKNYYLEADYLKIDVIDLNEIMQNRLTQMKYIDLTDDLELSDYYKTDLHWKQENLTKVVRDIEKEMNIEDTSNINYQIKEFGNFYGTYYGQLGMNIAPDKISILNSNTIENATTYNYETQKSGKVYDEEKWQTSSDKYDIYLSGPTALIEIENTNGPEGRELILFRDSFGSSIAPLLLENYQKITLIDLRYISSRILDEYIDFENQDVLFLYNTLVLNQNVFK